MQSKYGGNRTSKIDLTYDVEMFYEEHESKFTFNWPGRVERLGVEFGTQYEAFIERMKTKHRGLLIFGSIE